MLFPPVLIAVSMGVRTALAAGPTTVNLGTNLDSAPQSIKVVNMTYMPVVAFGGVVIYGYAVTNPGTMPLSNVTIADDKCQPITVAFGDTNGNRLLDPGESWMYACTTFLTSDKVNTVTVSGAANGITVGSSATASVNVGPPPVTPVVTPALPNTGIAAGW